MSAAFGVGDLVPRSTPPSVQRIERLLTAGKNPPTGVAVLRDDTTLPRPPEERDPRRWICYHTPWLGS